MRVVLLVCSVVCLMATQVRADDDRFTAVSASAVAWQEVRTKTGKCYNILAPIMANKNLELFGALNAHGDLLLSPGWKKEPITDWAGYYTSRGFPAVELWPACTDIPDVGFTNYAVNLFPLIKVYKEDQVYNKGETYNKEHIDEVLKSLNNEIIGNTKRIEEHKSQVTNEMMNLITPDVIAEIREQLLPEVEKQVIEDLKRQGLIAED